MGLKREKTFFSGAQSTLPALVYATIVRSGGTSEKGALKLTLLRSRRMLLLLLLLLRLAGRGMLLRRRGLLLPGGRVVIWRLAVWRLLRGMLWRRRMGAGLTRRRDLARGLQVQGYYLLVRGLAKQTTTTNYKNSFAILHYKLLRWVDLNAHPPEADSAGSDWNPRLKPGSSDSRGASTGS